ncbi:hypothetical protein [Leptothoe spongobia]|uniref:Uncharacterized protein n=1 Tax=Leptothoe spongobia TAU-MAC 1115 TaxID=1967444 RepID=A0A947GJV3_9CYAN|nr:hypothetical protein [Leptothoe spongobia]MBT9316303.1 hypothetical protein [Leptothoe spongobia TAU-MAC 1115]
MDPNAAQQLLGLLQQMTTLIQGMAGGDAGGDDPMADPTGGDPSGMETPDMTADPSMGDPTAGDPMAMGDAAGGDNLHDRVSQLEEHTGLQKSAGAGLLTRITKLEEALLGVEYQGAAVDRVDQLAKSLGIVTPQQQPVSTASSGVSDDAPEEIPLESLIKAAIRSELSTHLQKSSEATLPDVSDLRQAQPVIQRQPARREPTTLQTDDALMKSAAQFGWEESDLDEEVTFGDVLQLQYNAQQGGSTLFSDDD